MPNEPDKKTKRKPAAKRRKPSGRNKRKSTKPAALDLDAAVAEAWRQLQAGDTDGAAKLAETIVKQHPTAPRALHLRAIVALTQRRLDDAVADLTAAIELDSADPALRADLGVVHRARGDLAAAITCYRDAIELSPEFVEAFANLGNALRAAGQHDDAVAAFQKAIKLRPAFAEAHNNLGLTHQDAGRADDAVESFRRATLANPALADPHINLANYLRQSGRLTEALAHYSQALAIQPNDGLRLQVAFAVPPIIASTQAIAATRRRVGHHLAALERQSLKIENPLEEARLTGFFLTYHAENDLGFRRRLATLFRNATPSLSYTAPHVARSAGDGSDGRLKIGFVSCNLKEHTIGRLNRGLIAELSRERFHVTVFQNPPRDDPMAKWIREAADEAVGLPHDLGAARRLIAECELDALIFTDIGMDPIVYYLAFARLAPVQCATWGHPETTGIETIDYFVSSALMEPDDGESHYSERLVKLSTPPPYYYRPATPATAKTREAFGLDTDAHVYLCPQTLFKLHPDFDPILAGILREDRAGQVVLIDGIHANWRQQIAARLKNTAPDITERVVFVPSQPHADFLSLIGLADVMLDTPHFTGGNTSYEALALGTPVVTLPGALMRGRVTHGLYRLMDLPDCVALTAEDYVRIAVELGADKARRAEVSQRILARNDVLFENRDAVRGWEEFLETAVAEARKS